MTEISSRKLMVIILSIFFEFVILFWLYKNYTPTYLDPGNSFPSHENLSGNAIVNGDFEKGRAGWKMPNAINKEESGNHYAVNNSSWSVSQEIKLTVGATYEVKARTRKGTAEGPARITITYYDAYGERLAQYNDITYNHSGQDWEAIHETITVPGQAAISKIHLLTEETGGYHCFDDIEIFKAESLGNKPTTEETQKNSRPDKPDSPDKIEKPEAYVVKKGDTLSAISQRFNTTVEVLVKENNLSDPNIIAEGQIINIPQN